MFVLIYLFYYVVQNRCLKLCMSYWSFYVLFNKSVLPPQLQALCFLYSDLTSLIFLYSKYEYFVLFTFLKLDFFI